MVKVNQGKRKGKANTEVKSRESSLHAAMSATGLPELRVGIFEGGKLASVVSIPDPRVSFCKYWGQFHTNDRECCVALPLPQLEEAGTDDRFCVVDLEQGKVVARLLHANEADAMAHP